MQPAEGKLFRRGWTADESVRDGKIHPVGALWEKGFKLKVRTEINSTQSAPCGRRDLSCES